MIDSLQKYGFVLLTALVFLQLSGCGEKERVPSDLIPEGRMVEILKVIYVSEVKAIKNYDLKLQKNEYIQQHLYPAIFDSMQVDDSTFYKSYDWYEHHPSVFEVIMDSVAVGIERMSTDTTSTIAGPEDKSLDEIYRELNVMETIRDNKSKPSTKAK